MALIHWNDSMSVNIASIDRQHQKLIILINDLNDAMSQGKGNVVIGNVISGLIQYVREHFTYEKRFFTQYSYPEMDAHVAEHRKFIEEISSFKKKFEAEQLGLSISLISFLSDWLQKHIMVTDKAYSSFLVSNGVV